MGIGTLYRHFPTRDKLIEAVYRTETQNLSQGLEVVNPVRGGIHGGYWYLQNISSRGELFPAGEQHYGSLVEALEAAIEWWQVESWCRGVMVRRFHCRDGDAPPAPNGALT